MDLKMKYLLELLREAGITDAQIPGVISDARIYNKKYPEGWKQLQQALFIVFPIGQRDAESRIDKIKLDLKDRLPVANKNAAIGMVQFQSKDEVLEFLARVETEVSRSIDTSGIFRKQQWQDSDDVVGWYLFVPIINVGIQPDFPEEEV